MTSKEEYKKHVRSLVADWAKRIAELTENNVPTDRDLVQIVKEMEKEVQGK